MTGLAPDWRHCGLPLGYPRCRRTLLSLGMRTLALGCANRQGDRWWLNATSAQGKALDVQDLPAGADQHSLATNKASWRCSPRLLLGGSGS